MICLKDTPFLANATDYEKEILCAMLNVFGDGDTPHANLSTLPDIGADHALEAMDLATASRGARIKPNVKRETLVSIADKIKDALTLTERAFAEKWDDDGDTAERVISERLWKGRQSVNLERIVAYGDKRVRYLIEIDAYDFQSSGRAELWNGEKWHRVHFIPGQQLRARHTVSYVHHDVKPGSFDADMAELRAIVRAVVGV